MRLSRTIAATLVTGRTLLLTVLSSLPLLVLLYLVWPAGFTFPRVFLTAAEMNLIVSLAGSLITWRRSIFRPIDEQRRPLIEANPIIHFTTKERIASILQEGAERSGGRDGYVHLRPTGNWHSCWKFLGYGTYCFSGWPGKVSRFLAAGYRDAAIIIDPRDAADQIRVRKVDGAILLDGGYTGPARVQLL